MDIIFTLNHSFAPLKDSRQEILSHVVISQMNRFDDKFSIVVMGTISLSLAG